VCGGKPRIAGTRIRVQDILVWTEQGQSPDEIVAGHPHLMLADVYAVLAYYHDNRDKIDWQLRESEQFIAALQAQAMTRQPWITDAGGDPVSS
jgi:uncharacterized protein (DUF433 family)